jgi:hypothetical protein
LEDLEREEIVGAPGKDGNTSMPEQSNDLIHGGGGGRRRRRR